MVMELRLQLSRIARPLILATALVLPAFAFAPPTLTKAFGAASIPVGGTTTLTFTVSNNPGVDETGIGFTDNLPSGMTVATPNGLTGSCGGGTITATAGSGTVSLSGASLSGGTTCSFAVNVTVTSVGTLTNTTSTLASNPGVSSPAATASIIVTGSVSVPVLRPSLLAMLAGLLAVAGWAFNRRRTEA